MRDHADVIDSLRAVDPAATTADRRALDARAQAELHALLADGDELAPRRLRRQPGRGPRRWNALGAAAAAVAVLLTGTLGGAQIAALRGDDQAPRSALVDPGGPSSGAAAATSDTPDAVARQRMQATLDAYRAATAKATPPYLFGALSGRDLIEAQLRLDPTHDPAVGEAVRSRRLLGVPIQPRWAASWDAFRTRAVPDAPRVSPTGVAPTHSPRDTLVPVQTATGMIEVDGMDLTMGHEGSGVHLLVPYGEAGSYVDLPRADPTGRPAFVRGYDSSSRTIGAAVIEDENATRGEYALDVREEHDVVVVSVRVIRDSRPTAGASAGVMRRMRTVELPAVQLKEPLAGRPMLDAATGSYVDSAGW